MTLTDMIINAFEGAEQIDDSMVWNFHTESRMLCRMIPTMFGEFDHVDVIDDVGQSFNVKIFTAIDAGI